MIGIGEFSLFVFLIDVGAGSLMVSGWFLCCWEGVACFEGLSVSTHAVGFSMDLEEIRALGRRAFYAGVSCWFLPILGK